MAKLYAIPEETLVGIADAIRTKTGSDEQMTVPAFASAIEGITGTAKMDSGEFILDAVTSLQLYPIAHNLGARPKLVAGWLVDEVTSDYFSGGFISSIYVSVPVNMSASANVCYFLQYNNSTSGGVSRVTPDQTAIDSNVALMTTRISSYPHSTQTLNITPKKIQMDCLDMGIGGFIYA